MLLLWALVASSRFFSHLQIKPCSDDRIFQNLGCFPFRNRKIAVAMVMTIELIYSDGLPESAYPRDIRLVFTTPCDPLG